MTNPIFFNIKVSFVFRVCVGATTFINAPLDLKLKQSYTLVKYVYSPSCPFPVLYLEFDSVD